MSLQQLKNYVKFDVASKKINHLDTDIGKCMC